MDIKYENQLKNLKEIGLTKNEAKIYISLIRLGKGTANEVAKESGVTYGRIYEILRSLEQKSLVTLIPDKTKIFIPTNPENLNKIIEDKESKLNKLKDEVKNLEKIYTLKEKPPIEVITGRNKFIKYLREQEEKTKLYNLKYDCSYSPEIVRGFLNNKKKGFEPLTLTSNRDENQRNIKKWLKIDDNLKEIKNNGFAMSIGEEEMFFVLIDSFTIVTIRDKNMIDVMKLFFKNTYNNAKKIN